MSKETLLNDPVATLPRLGFGVLGLGSRVLGLGSMFEGAKRPSYNKKYELALAATRPQMNSPRVSSSSQSATATTAPFLYTSAGSTPVGNAGRVYDVVPGGSQILWSIR